MDFIELSEICNGNRIALNGIRKPLALFKELYDGPMEADAIFAELKRMDFASNETIGDTLDDRIVRRLMDAQDRGFTCEEQLLYRLRMEHAAFTLGILSGRVGRHEAQTIRLQSELLEECVAWALVHVWAAGGLLWLKRTSIAFSKGLDSAFLDS